MSRDASPRPLARASYLPTDGREGARDDQHLRVGDRDDRERHASPGRRSGRTGPRRDQAAPAGDLGEWRLPHDRDADRHRLRAPDRGARRPLHRSCPRRRDGQRECRPRRGSTRVLRDRARLRPRPARARATARRRGEPARGLRGGRRRGAAVRRRLLRRGQLRVRQHVRAGSGADRRRDRPGDPSRWPDRTRRAHARRLHRSAVQDHRRARPAAGRVAVTHPVGHRGAAPRPVRRRRPPGCASRSATMPSGTARPIAT